MTVILVTLPAEWGSKHARRLGNHVVSVILLGGVSITVGGGLVGKVCHLAHLGPPAPPAPLAPLAPLAPCADQDLPQPPDPQNAPIKTAVRV